MIEESQLKYLSTLDSLIQGEHFLKKDFNGNDERFDDNAKLPFWLGAIGR